MSLIKNEDLYKLTVWSGVSCIICAANGFLIGTNKGFWAGIIWAFVGGVIGMFIPGIFLGWLKKKLEPDDQDDQENYSE
jgi:hypothetical protein